MSYLPLAQLSSIQLSQFGERFNLERLRTEAGALQSRFANLKPPQEFFDFKRLSKPANFSEVQNRVSYNLGYFGTNYAAIVGILSVYSLLTNLLLLFVILFIFGGVIGISRLNGEDFTTPFGKFNTSQLYTGLLVVAVPLGFFASPVSTMLWLIGASSVSVFSHASLMEKPIETVFEEETV